MELTRLGAYSLAEIEQSLRGDGLSLQVANFRCLIQSDTGLLSTPLHLLYRHYVGSMTPDGFYDFRVTLNRKRVAPWKPNEVEFGWEGHSPFPPLPLAQTHPLFEWGLNWCIATLSGAHAVVHSAVVERDGGALVLPGDPGAGKSTLCAALALSDWRLLSDELTIVAHASGLVQPMPRPISLKSKSIDIVRAGFARAELTLPVHDTHKGSIAYVRPADEAVDGWTRPVPIRYVIFPRFAANSEFTVETVSRAQALAELMSHTFNVGLLGQQGFTSLANALAGAECYAVEYPDLASITSWIHSTCRHPA
ncbi:MAG: HprK-related kinase [Rhodoferax sp.]|nr:HprK-related kinase [Rhodoferax sp.]